MMDRLQLIIGIESVREELGIASDGLADGADEGSVVDALSRACREIAEIMGAVTDAR